MPDGHLFWNIFDMFTYMSHLVRECFNNFVKEKDSSSYKIYKTEFEKDNKLRLVVGVECKAMRVGSLPVRVDTIKSCAILFISANFTFYAALK